MALDARFQRLITGLIALGLASEVHPALAQDASPAASQSATNGADTAVTQDTSYSATVGLVYGIGYAATGAGFYMARPDRPSSERPYGLRIAGAIVLPSGFITTLFGPMLTHLDHGYLGKGLLSVGGQLVAAGAGVGAGYAVASIAGAEEPGTAMLVGGLSAHAGWAVFDTLVLARDELVVERTIPAPNYALTLEPTTLGRGARMGLSFRF